MTKSVTLVVAMLVTILLSGLGGAAAQNAASPNVGASHVLPDVIAARLTTTPDRARLILDLSMPGKFAIVSLEDPARIAVDVNAAALKFTKTEPQAGAGLVTDYSVKMTGEGRARALLTLAEPAQVQQAYVLDAFGDQPARLVVDLIPDSRVNFDLRVAHDRAVSPNGAGKAPPNEVVTPPGISASAPVVAPATAKPLIVLDPGHGGVDGGAVSSGGVKEKDVVLAFALKLQQVLVDTGRFDVALTRTDDSYLTLEQRVQLARNNKADLFISLHADIFQQPQVRGTSIYTRDENATDILDKVLADNENKSDIVAGFAAPKAPPSVVNVLIELMRRQMRKEAFIAASDIVHALEPSVPLRKFPVRQADFFVLQAPDVPSMLIELGFLSNADDTANLTNADWRDRTAEAVARGIGTYFDSMNQQ